MATDSAPPQKTSLLNWSRLERAPVILQAYLAFAVIASVAHMSASFVPPFGRVAFQYIGSGLGYYLFTLYFAVYAMISPQRKAVYGVVLLLALSVVFEGVRTFRFAYGPDSARQDFANPYLMYDSWQPAITVAVPLTWIMLLVSPGMQRWMRAAPEDDSARGQLTVRDLLYFMATLGVGLATALYLVGMVDKARLATPSATPATAPTTPGAS